MPLPGPTASSPLTYWRSHSENGMAWQKNSSSPFSAKMSGLPAPSRARKTVSPRSEPRRG
ncbi:hypothetical protein SMICM304S_09723 [Streptomyces microflavus]